MTNMTKLTREEVAQICHEANRAYCLAIGDDSQLPWEECPDWQKESALMGVDLHASGEDHGPEVSHESWMAQKLADGWVYGEVKDAEKKEHPCIVPFADLPVEQQAKDYIFAAIVRTAVSFVESEEEKVPPPPANKTTVPAPGCTRVKYIGRREPHRDGIYETGDWTIGMVKDVPDAVALKMLKHPDVYCVPAEEQAEATLVEKVEVNEKKDDEEADQNARDAIAAMATKEAVAAYAMNNFGMKIPKTLSLENMKSQATMLVDQYGAK